MLGTGFLLMLMLGHFSRVGHHVASLVVEYVVGSVQITVAAGRPRSTGSIVVTAYFCGGIFLRLWAETPCLCNGRWILLALTLRSPPPPDSLVAIF